MGRGFGRGAKAVAIVTHAQAKPTKKAPRGLRVGRKHRRKMYRSQHDAEDPNTMLDTGDNRNNAAGGKKKKSSNNSPLSIEQRIAGIQFKEVVTKGRKLKNLRKQIMNQVKTLRRKEHLKREAQAKAEVRDVERRVMLAKNRREEMQQKAAAAAAAAASVAAAPAGKKKSSSKKTSVSRAPKK